MVEIRNKNKQDKINFTSNTTFGENIQTRSNTYVANIWFFDRTKTTFLMYIDFETQGLKKEAVLNRGFISRYCVKNITSGKTISLWHVPSVIKWKYDKVEKIRNIITQESLVPLCLEWNNYFLSRLCWKRSVDLATKAYNFQVSLLRFTDTKSRGDTRWVHEIKEYGRYGPRGNFYNASCNFVMREIKRLLR